MPHRAEDAATVKVEGCLLLADMDGFSCPPP